LDTNAQHPLLFPPYSHEVKAEDAKLLAKSLRPASKWGIVKLLSKRMAVMKNNIVLGLLLGCVAGVLDLIPMLLQGLTWDANLSAFFLWAVSGFMLATSTLKLHPVLKGIIIPFICLLPSAFIIGWKEPPSLLPIVGMTLILGALLGFAYNKLAK